MALRTFAPLAALALVSLAAHAQEATGKWNASIDSPQGPFAMVFDFKVDGDKLTGTMSNDFMGSTPISEGMVKGKELMFKLKLEGGPNGPMTISYTGVVDGDHLSLTSKVEGAPPDSPTNITFAAMRAK
jgi:hypothetical protein